jgi:ABC-type sulfate/molybdate transport systems ATPase subunit
VAEKLKCNTRHCYTSSGRHESVAEHSWRIALMAMLLTEEFPEADMNKVIRMCLIHDLGEAFSLADRMMVLNSGSIEVIGEPKELIDNPRSELLEVYLNP